MRIDHLCMLSPVYLGFFAAFPAVTMLIDLSVLLPGQWPPHALGALRSTLHWWTSTHDPLMGQAPVWFKAMTLVEVAIIPGYSALALRSLVRNSYPPWMVPLTFIFSTVCVYSVLLLAAENIYGLKRNLLDKDGTPWLLAYAPFVLIPMLWSRHVLQAVANHGRAAPPAKVLADLSKRRTNRSTAGRKVEANTHTVARERRKKSPASLTSSTNTESSHRVTPTVQEARLLVGEADMRTPITTRSGAQARRARRKTADVPDTHQGA